MEPNAPIVITGTSGAIGRIAAAALRDAGYAVTGFDRTPNPHFQGHVTADLTDAEALVKATKTARAIIHLAAVPDDEDFLSKLLPSNIIGLHNVLEAARINRVPRLILASTGQVIWDRQLYGPWPVRVDVTPTPRYWYACTKLFTENAGFVYAKHHQMDVLAVRLGFCPRSQQHADEVGPRDTAKDVYFSPGDAGRFFCKAIQAASGFGFQIVYATSNPLKQWRYDMEPAKRLLGYEPQDSWPDDMQKYWEKNTSS